MPTIEEVRHWLYVARGFSPLSRLFWLGLLHDTVEDGYFPRALANAWPALDALTRRDGERYSAYIDRVAGNKHARAVKLRDLQHNLTRNGGPKKVSLMVRYADAWHRLTDKPLPSYQSVL